MTNTAIDGMQFAREIGLPNPPSTLYFLHVLQPHQPWALLPSGRHYNDPWVVPGVTDDWSQGEEKRLRPNDLLVEQALQRHLLQLRAVDRLVGTILRQLRRQGLLDRALVVVTADHGASFRAGGWIRRTTPDNLPDIAAVPLFVKYPHQARGHEDRRSAETIDVLPTIADVLGIALPWDVDGRSLRSPPVNREVQVATPRDTTIAGSFDFVESGAARRRAAKRNVARLGHRLAVPRRPAARSPRSRSVGLPDCRCPRCPGQHSAIGRPRARRQVVGVRARPLPRTGVLAIATPFGGDCDSRERPPRCHDEALHHAGRDLGRRDARRAPPP